ncbi:MAG: hypothetical protein ACEQSR_16095 [Candidatus Methylacidiphilales bacterium]
MEITNDAFKQKFKSISLENNGILLNELIKCITNIEKRYLHATLNLYYNKYPKVKLDLDYFRKTLELEFNQSSCYVLNFNEPFWGGYELKHIDFNNSAELNDNEINDTINQNWEEFINEIKGEYWTSSDKIKSFDAISNIDFFEDRLPKTQREKILALNTKYPINGELKEIIYKYFDAKNVISYYHKLIELFFPDFQFNKLVSTKKIKRYTKRISNGYFLSLYIDFGFIETELKRTYLELPHIKIELFSEALSSHVKEEFYLVYQEEYPIVRIALPLFVGNPDNFRIGDSSKEEIKLKKELFYNFDVYSTYINIYLNYIELILENLLTRPH